MEYTCVLFDRFALEHFRAGVQEVHLRSQADRLLTPNSLNMPNDTPRENHVTNMNTSLSLHKQTYPKDGKNTYSAGSVNGQLLKQSDFHFYRKDNYFLQGIKS